MAATTQRGSLYRKWTSQERAYWCFLSDDLWHRQYGDPYDAVQEDDFSKYDAYATLLALEKSGWDQSLQVRGDTPALFR